MRVQHCGQRGHGDALTKREQAYISANKKPRPSPTQRLTPGRKSTLASLTADGAYDGEPTYPAARARQPNLPPDVVIPPRACAVPSTADPSQHTTRDRHIVLMAEKGRMAWQRLTGYGRALAETAMSRREHLIGPKLRARTISGQQGEAAIAVSVLNRMTRTAKPVSVRVA